MKKLDEDLLQSLRETGAALQRAYAEAIERAYESEGRQSTLELVETIGDAIHTFSRLSANVARLENPANTGGG